MNSYATVEYAALRGARIINISSNRKNLDSGLLDAIEDHPEILFVNCAGNEGLDIKQHPNYPAAHPFPNLLVVANSVGRGLNPRSNFSVELVQLAEVGTHVPVIDVNEKISLRTGSSFSAPKISHLAAEILTIDPHLQPTEVVDIIRESIDQTTPSDLVGKVKWPGSVDREKALRLAARKRDAFKIQH
jgi:subtilisin family serine protease